ncbi:MAG: NlpC/P60 family protein [Clostridiales bacterium]|nr:NlpC/P60 family protein [Clostridiales bacterium]
MKKKVIIKSAFCFGMAAVVALTVEGIPSASATLAQETGVAGISLTLDKYYSSASVEDMAPIVLETKDAVSQDNAEAEPVEEEKPEAEEKEVEKKSEYENVGISIANDYVNIRAHASQDAKVLGKLYKGSAATILATKGEWVKIKSGSVTGYINKEYLAIGFDAEELVDKYATKWAVINTTTLKVREKNDLESSVLTLVPEGEEYEIIKDTGHWYKILIDDADDGGEQTVGFILKEYADVRVEFKQAISIEEEEAERKRKEEAERAEKEQADRLAESQKSSSSSSGSSSSTSSSGNSSSSSSSSGSSSGKSSQSSSSSKKEDSSSSKTTVVGSGSGADIAAYALKFVGNPYVYGGTSLTNGTDCSGFTYSVYKSFGISIPRTSSAQAGVGKSVDFSELKAGDLIFYGKGGSINHVAMYIGGGQVVHASNPKSGIRVSNYRYRTPICARRIVE